MSALPPAPVPTRAPKTPPKQTQTQESHCGAINALEFNLASRRGACRELFATAAGGQVAVYDGAHLGGRVAVVVQYAPPPEGAAGGGAAAAGGGGADAAASAADGGEGAAAAATGGEGGPAEAATAVENAAPLDFLCCAWLRPPGSSAGAGANEHEEGDDDDDAWLAAGASDGAVHVISVADAAVVRRLDAAAAAGPASPAAASAAVVALSAAAPDRRPQLLLALGADGAAHLWDAWAGRRLAVVSGGGGGGSGGSGGAIACAALAPCGGFFLTAAARGGRLMRWRPAAATAAAAAAAPPAASADWQEGCELTAEPLELPGLGASSDAASDDGAIAIEALAFLPGSGRLLVCDASGGARVYDFEARSLIAQWRAPGLEAAADVAGGTRAGRLGLGWTADGAVIAMGCARGETLLFEAARGARLARLGPHRAEAAAPVRGCGLSEDGRCVAAAAGAGFVTRFEYRWPAAADGGGGGGEAATAGQAATAVAAAAGAAAAAGGGRAAAADAETTERPPATAKRKRAAAAVQ